MSTAKKSDMPDRPDTSGKRQQPMSRDEAMLTQIEISLQAFSDEFLNSEAEEPLVNLWEAAQQCPALNLTRGDPDVWAAAIAYAFARMNFLLDDDGPLHIERAEFFNFFEGCNKSTVTQKATRIETALDFDHGHREFCLPDIIEAMPKLVYLPNGLVMPERIFDRLCSDDDGPEIEVSFADEAQSAAIEHRIAEENALVKKRKRVNAMKSSGNNAKKNVKVNQTYSISGISYEA